MKRNFLSLIMRFVLAITIFITSCSKDENNVPANSTPEGIWSGTGQYGTGPGNPVYALTINFKTSGIADITGDNGAGPDIASGTWLLTGDSIKVAYRYAGSSADYTLTSRFTPGATSMTGTIGLGTATTGTGIFSISRQ